MRRVNWNKHGSVGVLKSFWILSRALLLVVVALSSSFFCQGVDAAPSSSVGRLQVDVDPTNPRVFHVKVDGTTWLQGRVRPQWFISDTQKEFKLVDSYATPGVDDHWGEYLSRTWEWSTATESSTHSSQPTNTLTLTTDITVYRQRELVIFRQHWPEGLSMSPPNNNNNKLWQESQNNGSPFLASFPTFDVNATRTKQDLSYLAWGDCMAADTQSGDWEGSPEGWPEWDGVTSGVPIVWHDTEGRSLVMSPMQHFFVSGQALVSNVTTPQLQCGVRNTVKTLPSEFTHATILVGGQGIQQTLTTWGNHLLYMGNKTRTDPYQDFVLSHLGYWTDNGAYYYHLDTIPHYNNQEEALKGVKADLIQRQIPVRYFQWDDYWMESKNDIPGITSWTPLPEVFPSGFTDWLQMPLSLYAPMYYKENVWSHDYHWKIDDMKNESAIPLDPNFYKDLFANGTKIGMKMFEQDFLCSINTDTALTNNDVDSGATWMQHMDEAAKAAGVTLQFCMMNACHALHSTLVQTMTNGRATGDNCRGDPFNIRPMGQNGLLFYALGFFPSRDNVWTTDPDTEQKGCNRACVESNALADNAVALLGGGPYGPSDAVGFTSVNVVMRAVRSDGVLVRPSWPLSSLDVTFLTRERGTETPLVWAAHDDYDGVGRWSYIVGINLVKSFSLTPSDLLQRTTTRITDEDNILAVAWNVNLGTGHEDSLKVVRFDSLQQPLELPAAAAKDNDPGATLWAVAPVLPNGMALLGDVSKWATMSTRRFRNVQTTKVTISATVIGSPDEKVSIDYVRASSVTAERTTCDFSTVGSDDCNPKDEFGDTDCFMELSCSSSMGCTCSVKRASPRTGESVEMLRKVS